MEQEDLGVLLDQWANAGHHIGNHTHSHPFLDEIGAEAYIEEIDRADELLAPWIAKAPGRHFRYTGDMWGGDEENLVRVKKHLGEQNYTVATVTTFFYEWSFNSAFENCLATGDEEGAAYLKRSFVEFSVAQLRHDMKSSVKWFGREIKGITLGHTLPFFAEVAEDRFGALKEAGLKFIPFEEAAADPSYEQAASGATYEFMPYQQKLAVLRGQSMPRIAPEGIDIDHRVHEMGDWPRQD